jgi:hypothetical protein
LGKLSRAPAGLLPLAGGNSGKLQPIAAASWIVSAGQLIATAAVLAAAAVLAGATLARLKPNPISWPGLASLAASEGSEGSEGSGTKVLTGPFFMFLGGGRVVGSPPCIHYGMDT